MTLAYSLTGAHRHLNFFKNQRPTISDEEIAHLTMVLGECRDFDVIHSYLYQPSSVCSVKLLVSIQMKIGFFKEKRPIASPGKPHHMRSYENRSHSQ